MREVQEALGAPEVLAVQVGPEVPGARKPRVVQEVLAAREGLAAREVLAAQVAAKPRRPTCRRRR